MNFLSGLFGGNRNQVENRAAVTPPPPAPPPEPALSITKLEDEFKARYERSTTEQDRNRSYQAVGALMMMESDFPGDRITPSQIQAFSQRMSELSTFISNKNRDMGVPSVEDRRLALTAAETALGAAVVAQFVIASAQYGELARFAADVQPGAGQQLGAAFTGSP